VSTVPSDKRRKKDIPDSLGRERNVPHCASCKETLPGDKEAVGASLDFLLTPN
jgi:hypothetical protein